MLQLTSVKTTLRSIIHSRAFLLLCMYAVFFLWSLSFMDPDFGWHVRAGQYFAAHGVPHTDVFTYTAADFPWVSHEWLSDIFLAKLGDAGSYGLLAAVYAGLWTLALGIAGRGVHPVVLIVAAVGMLPFLGVRAMVWSVLGMAVLMLLLRQKDQRWRLLIPPLFLLWANVHGSFLIGIAYGGWQVLRERSWKLALLGVASLLVTLVNPYGLELYREIFQTMFDGDLHARVSEWSRFAIPFSAAAYMVLWFGITAQHGFKLRPYIRFDVLLAGMTLMSARMVPLFIIVSLQPLWADIRAIDERIARAGSPVEFQRRVRRIGQWLLIAACAGLFAIGMVRSHHDAVSFPVGAVAYLREHPCEGNVFNSYNYGGYLIHELPSHKVYIDGRMPSWRLGDTKYMDDYLRVLEEKAFRQSEFARYGITCVLIEEAERMVEELV